MIKKLLLLNTTLLLAALLSPCLMAAAAPAVSIARRDQAHSEAERIWEQAVAAKGGRERLYSVHNMVISSYGEYLTHLFKKNTARHEILYVFPNKEWIWSDFRPDVFGLRVTMKDFESKLQYIVTPNGRQYRPKPISSQDPPIMYVLLPYLIETKWLKPVPMDVRAGKVDACEVDLVRTDVGGRRVDFGLDRATHLPASVTYYDETNDEASGVQIVLSEYGEVDGIKVPKKNEAKGGMRYKEDVRFNVEYNQEIFRKPPRIEDGPEAWKITR